MAHRDWDIKCKVYIGGLGNNASKYEIEDSFTKYGPLRNIWVARNPPGFAFVEFEDARDAEDSVRGLDGTRMCGNRVRVEMSSGKRRERNYERPQRGGGGGGGGSGRRYGGGGGDRGYNRDRRSRSPRRRPSRSPRSRSESRSPVRRSRSGSRDRR